MDAVTLLLTALWFLTCFVLRIAIALRTTGDTGVRVATSPASAAGVARLLFLAATLAVGVSPVLVAGGVLDPIDVLDTPAVWWLGAMLAVAGMVATFAAQLAMGRSWRIGVDPEEHTDLVTAGVFAVVRNPIFTTMAATAIGLTLMAPTVLAVAAAALLLVALELQVRTVEEPYLRRCHGPAYAAYTARVGRFLPALGRTSPAR